MDLHQISQTGFRVDYESFLREVIIPEQKQLDVLRNQLVEEIGECDLDNPASVSRNLTAHGYTVKYGVPFDWLKKHCEEETVFSLLLKYRKKQAFLKQYGKSFREFIAPDGRIHPQYFDNVSVTGRMSAKNPAAMSLDGRIMQYVVPDNGSVLLSMDFAALDFRSLASVSHDPYLSERLSFRNFDIHAYNAGLMFKTQEISAEQRKQGKKLGLAIVYGMTAQTLAKQLSKSSHRLISPEEASGFIKEVYDSFPLVQTYQRNLLKGRIGCRTRGGKQFDAKSLTAAQILNYPVQGTSSEGFKVVVDGLEKTCSYAKITMLIHDCVMVEYPERYADKAETEIPAVAEKVMSDYLGIESFVKTKMIFPQADLKGAQQPQYCRKYLSTEGNPLERNVFI